MNVYIIIEVLTSHKIKYIKNDLSYEPLVFSAKTLSEAEKIRNFLSDNGIRSIIKEQRNLKKEWLK